MGEAVIAVLGTGDMGSAVGSMLRRGGYRVVTSLTGRSALSRRLAHDAGLEDRESLEAVVAGADFLLSIVPPAAAFGFAERVATIVRASGRPIVFADCNAVSPRTAETIAALFSGSSAEFADVGIVGPAPRAGTKTPTRFYVSGEARARIVALGVPELSMVDLGPVVGRASALKMCYGGMNKGTDALWTAILLAAARLGVGDELMAEFDSSQGEAAARMRHRIPFLAATAARYVGEMQEIAATFETVGVTPCFHRGAEWLYARLAESGLASESRATLPEQRPLADALDAYLAVLADD